MEVYFETDFDVMLTLLNGFEVPKDKKGKKLRPRHWTEEQKSLSKANEKVISILL